MSPQYRVEIEQIECACGCGEMIFDKNKYYDSRSWITGHNLRAAHRMTQISPYGDTDKIYDIMNTVEENLDEIFNGRSVLQYGTLEELDDLIY